MVTIPNVHAGSAGNDKKAKPGDDGLARSSDFIDFIYENPTAFHACDFLRRLLGSYGYEYISEREPWDNLKNGGKYYTLRNGTSLLAFEIGKNWKPGNGVGLVGCHVDANCLKLKPVSIKPDKEGYKQLGAAVYGGPLLSTWWDRDLGIGGRVVVHDGKDKVKTKLAYIRHPVARVPSLAPHFGKPARGPFNQETQMTPIFGLDEGDVPELSDEERQSPLAEKHDIQLLRAIAENINVPVKDMIQLELELFDTQRGAVGGLSKQLMFAPRLDDKLACFASIYGLINASDSSNNVINAVALYDNEEVGSLTKQGAKGHLFEAAIDRINAKFGGSDSDKQLSMANSFFISSDVTHAVNPNFADDYLDEHKPRLNVGMVVKLDANGHTTSDAVSTALIEEIARLNDDKIQYFQVRNDTPSGGTIGPALSSTTGIRAIDLGIPQLAMHSVRAATGSKDVALGIHMFQSFFKTWEQVDAEFKKGDL